MVTIGTKQLCEYCLEENCGEPCRFCGFDKASYKKELGVLPPGSVLSGKYIVGKIIGQGGFGITYLAYDIKREKKIALKEYYPITYASRGENGYTVAVTRMEDADIYKNGMEKFYEEASLVSKFNGNPNIVSVYEFFYENDTAYFAMELLRGVSLKTYITEHGTLSPEETLYIADKVSGALLAAHSANTLHRDISPDNVMLCEDGNVKLIDFGAARQVAADNPKSMSVILKQGFAPLEQYQKRGKQGPWTDIYSLGATLYYAATMTCIDDPMTRLDDDSEFQANKHEIEPQLWEVISRALNLKIEDRYQDAVEFRAALNKIAYKPRPIKVNGSEPEREAVPIAAAVSQSAPVTTSETATEQTGQTAPAVPPTEYVQSAPVQSVQTASAQSAADDFVPQVAEPAEKKPLSKKLIAILSSAIGVILVAGITLIAVTLSKSKNSINVQPGNNDPQNSAVQSTTGGDNNTPATSSSVTSASSSGTSSSSSISSSKSSSSSTASSSSSNSSSSSSTSTSSSSKSSSSSTTTSSSKSSSSSTSSSSAAPTPSPTTAYSKGKWSGNTFTSDFLGIKIQLDSDWTPYSDAELAELNGIADMSYDSAKTVLDKGDGLLYMYAGNSVLTFIGINVEDSYTAGSMTDEEFITNGPSILKSMYEELGYPCNAVIVDLNFLGENVKGIEATVDLGNVIMYELMVNIPAFASPESRYNASVTIDSLSNQALYTTLDKIKLL